MSDYTLDYTLYSIDGANGRQQAIWEDMVSAEGTRPPLVVVDGWNASTGHVHGTQEWTIGAFRFAIPGDFGSDIVRHPLDGTVTASSAEADRIKYEAGLTAFMVRNPA